MDQEPIYFERLDQCVASMLPAISRASCAKLIDQGKVMVNGEVFLKAGYKLRVKDIVTIDPEAIKEVPIPDIDLPILYEDDDCIVINKPVGLLSHSKGAFNPEATVGTWLSKHTKGMEGDRAGIVHRLDRATSGVMICAKTPEALKWLQKQFSQRKTKKTYVAIVEGVPMLDEAIIDVPIERNPKQPQTFRAGSNGKQASTYYKIIASDDVHSLIELKPTTGRTHQLRVHLNYLKHPIVGDTLYGGEQANRMYLHAKSLEITLPNRERQTFEVPMPSEFNNIIKT